MTLTTADSPKVVIVGAGHGCRVHLPALRAAGFDVVGLVGGRLERASRLAEKLGIPAAYPDLETALAATGAQAVTVASPPPHHAGQVRTALDHGCHVLCEKPFAMNAAEARDLLARAQAAGVVHAIGNQMRTLPERRVAARAIADGLIGEPRFISLVQFVGLVADTAAKKPDWWFDSAAGGGWLGASGSHQIDMIRSWLGDFTSLSAALPIVADRRNVAEDSFAVRFELANGVEGVLQQSGGAWGPHAALTRVAGTHGTVWLDGGKAWIADKDGTRELPVPDDLRLPHMEPSSDPREMFLHIELPPSQRLFEEWRAAIEGRPVSPGAFATFADGLACMEVIDAIRQSASQDGARIEVAA